MIDMAQVNILIDDELKSRADALLNELGMNMATAFHTFVRQILHESGISFEITTHTDLFYSESKTSVLKGFITRIDDKKIV